MQRRQLEWLLLTNVRLVSFGEAPERITSCWCRWLTAVFFRLLESGCQVAGRRSGTANHLKRFIALLRILVWRSYWLTHFSSCALDALGAVVLTDHDTKALYAAIKRTLLSPADVPTVRPTTHRVAQLAGVLNCGEAASQGRW